MKCRPHLLQLTALIFLWTNSYAKTSPVQNIFPAGRIIYNNIPCANDTLKKHLLDVDVPATAGKNTPLVVWIHGGAWMMNDKYADMGYMKNTVRSFIDSGYV